ncbi:MAG: hypothetical protein ACRD1N_08255 [Terriglobia bacterium]
MREHLKSIGCVLGVLILATVVSVQAGAQDHKDPKAVEIANTMQNAMGGLANWQKARFVRFDFIVKNGSKTMLDRSHLWDKWNGRYRLEEKTKDGKSEVVLFNSANKEGSVYIDGNTVQGDEASKDLQQAYAAYINDSWWLAMPWKWLYPGSNLKYLGERRRGHELFDVVELTFNSVGLTPGDMYHAWVSRQSHLMTHWDYVLQSHKRGSWDWEYTETNGIKLASNHVSADHRTQISMGDVRVLDSVDDAFFTDPSHTLRELQPQ